MKRIPKELVDDADWRSEFTDRPRIPRKGWDHVQKLLSESRTTKTPKVFLREKTTHTDIVLRFFSSSAQLPENVREAQAVLGMKMEAVFSELLWQRPQDGSTLWSTLVRTGYKAYCDTWLHFQKLLYCDHSHRAVDSVIRTQLKHMTDAVRPRAGRRGVVDEESASITRRYRELLVDCESLHRLIQRCRARGMTKNETRKAAYRKFNGRRFESLLFSKIRSAFGELPQGTLQAQLHDPESWKPTQLAIALVGLEREYKYQTIEKLTSAARKRFRGKHVGQEFIKKRIT